MTALVNQFVTTQTVEEQLRKGISPGALLLGDKKCYLTLENDWDRAYFDRNLDINGKAYLRDRSRSGMCAARLSVTFEDKSTTHFTVHAASQELAVANAPYFVQDIVNTLKIDRAVWKIEGSNDVHFTAYSKRVNARPGSLLAKVKNLKNQAKEQLDKFFAIDEDEL